MRLCHSFLPRVLPLEKYLRTVYNMCAAECLYTARIFVKGLRGTHPCVRANTYEKTSSPVYPARHILFGVANHA